MKYSKGYKYRLEENEYYDTGISGYNIKTESISLEAGGNLRVLKGYSWDGATMAFDTCTFMRGSLIHDALYELIRKKLIPIKERADIILREICLKDGMHPIRAWWIYKGVQWFGKGSTIGRKPIIST